MAEQDDEEEEDGQDSDQHQEEADADRAGLALDTNLEQPAGENWVDKRASSSRLRLDSEDIENGSRPRTSLRQSESPACG